MTSSTLLSHVYRRAAIRVYHNTLETYTQLPGNLVDEQGKDITIGDYLHSLVCPQLLDKSVQNGEVVVTKVQEKHVRILIHGIECALDTPLYWLHLNMAYIDNFVYIVIISS